MTWLLFVIPDHIWEIIGGLSIVVVTYWAGRKKGISETTKNLAESDSIVIKDKIFVQDYNQKQYNELFKEAQGYRLELFEYKEKVKVLEYKIEELLRKFNVYKNLKTEDE
jgi:hypothetical protein